MLERFRDAIFHRRTSLLLTKEESADKANISRDTWYRVENAGGTSSPSIETLARMAHALGCEVEVILMLNGEEVE